MSVDPVEQVSGTGIAVRGNDIDTDQIIPARFLKAITFDGLGEHAFADVRYDDSEPTNHPFNDSAHQDASILVVNDNFGCGSSREHAPQSLLRWGIDAIVGESFAEIFAGNCLALGIPTITANKDTIEALQSFVEVNPDADVTVDVDAETMTYDETTVDVFVGATQRRALLDGEWDTTALLRSNADAVSRVARELPYAEEQS